MNKDNAKDFIPLIQALADGKIIQYQSQMGWIDIDMNKSIYFNDEPFRYRVKPETEYPLTSLTGKELYLIFGNEDTQLNVCIAIANAAIKKAILDGDVILPENKS